jgi:hypothetical protein
MEKVSSIWGTCQINKDLQELETKKSSQDNITLERIRNAFLEPKIIQKAFLLQKPDEQRNTLIDVLWNASVANKKIANISFKEPYNVLSKIENKSDFNSVRVVRDYIRTEIRQNANKN